MQANGGLPSDEDWVLGCHVTIKTSLGEVGTLSQKLFFILELSSFVHMTGGVRNYLHIRSSDKSPRHLRRGFAFWICILQIFKDRLYRSATGITIWLNTITFRISL